MDNTSQDLIVIRLRGSMGSTSVRPVPPESDAIDIDAHSQQPAAVPFPLESGGFEVVGAAHHHLPDEIMDTVEALAVSPVVNIPSADTVDTLYIANHTKLYSSVGHLYITPTPTSGTEDGASLADFQKFNETVGFDQSETYNVKKRWHIIQFSNAQDKDRVYQALSVVGDIVGVGVDANGHCSGVCRATSYAIPNFNGIRVYKYFTPKLHGKKNTDELMCQCLLAWGKTLVSYCVNFEFHFPNVTIESVMSEWANLTNDLVQQDILECRVQAKKSKHANPRAQFISENHVDLVKLRKARAEVPEFARLTPSDDSIFPVQQYDPAPSQLMAWYRDLDNGGERKEFSIRSFLRDPDTLAKMHLSFALVTHGAPKFAKTLLAKSIAIKLAMMHQSKCDHEPFALNVSTVEELPRGGDKCIQSVVPVVMDDLRPNEQRLSRPPHTIEDMKVLGDTEVGGDMAGRYKEVHFAHTMPRIFTSNADDPHSFFRAFPENLENMTNEEVMRLSNDQLALVKRYTFCKLPRCVIPAALQAAHQERRNNALEEVAAQMFDGVNAIP
eukprot:TRINITY_DN57968_c0_g1_i1.p1 TRINITY_DN57968_c0_g1~~TRINITY_DN57968_c0_g1_i1.p1  ORF type:complete len:555 (-),score=71.38 TRINITY_DN57968_c0_g1_i1:27-1691(-)